MRDLRSFGLKSIDVHSPDWFLNMDGKRIGPYPLDALFGLANDGEIGSDQQISSRHIGDQWATLSEIKAAMLAPPAANTPPPERPTNIDNLVNPSPLTVGGTEDPADSLYNALQKSKELQAKKRENDRDVEERPFDNSLIQDPRKKGGPNKQLFLIAIFGFVFGISIWAMFQILNKKEGVASNSSTSTESKKTSASSNTNPPPPSQSTSKPPTTGSFSTGGFSNRPSKPAERAETSDESDRSRESNPPPQPIDDQGDIERAQQERDRERDQILKDAQQYQDSGAQGIQGGGAAQPIAPAMPMNESPVIAPGNADPNAAPYGSGHNPGVQGTPPNGGLPPSDTTFQQ